ncbi:TPA: macrolide family glycosyltransferase [Bacillus thuringiensis]|uniref:Glycosyl transferase n=3 Tax=Bacillus cereus group TaxID=86661 RepID=A0A9X6QB59_BACTU|nr:MULTISPECIES: macrolide family glycosyltransferase [Bacillus]MCO4215509.1 glycosyl transferase [Bacillus sp. 10017]MDM5375227.1 glycosyltransferase [Bacillus bombysepticus]NIE92637.1 glycosyl transferase [Bacillus sp. Ab-1751]AGE77890.1 Glycosyltransferase, MGT [Bacillus thuringiensis serovar kurstaki str. HD73]AHZ50965.1 MGT family glycosyltransferase [Bacillus thuringiensis serovar kurstaki str. YBT-1520]
MANVLVINFPGEGHINPTLAVVSELIQRGETVVSYCIEDYRKKVEATGAEFRVFENFLSQINIMERVNEGGSPLTMLSHMIEASERIVTQIVEETKEEKYDYLIYDNHFPVGRIIANILQLPSVSSCTTFAVNQYINFHDEQEARQVDEMDPLYQSCLAGMERWNKQYGMKCNSMYDIMNHPGDITIVYTSKEYQPRSEVFDESYKFVGPSIATRKEVGSFPTEDLKNEKVIFISMGTVFNEQPALYEKCFEAFKDVDATVVLVVGKKINISQFENIPKNFKLYNYVPQLEVLQHADVFVTHGGMNSSSEALYYGVPLVVIPVTGDQPFVAKRLTEVGAGIRLNRNELTSELLRETVKKVMDDVTFKENSRKVGESLRNAGGYQRAVEEIFKLKMKPYVKIK